MRFWENKYINISYELHIGEMIYLNFHGAGNYFLNI